jgi:2-polyprenyl-3-methyl-5-hydroxy-6-metoxy-1,4-benzoquinol methylase
MTASTATAESRLGHYAERHRRAFYLAFSHRSRFDYAARAVTPFAGKRLLDYGCGDGTFLSMVRDRFSEAVGADVATDQIDDCRARLGATGLQFVICDALSGPEHCGVYDVVCCQEVLEHCPVEVVETVLADLVRLARQDGMILISVPIEVGPMLIVKQVLRRLAGWRGIPGYQQGERYTFRELLKMFLAGTTTAIPRPLYGTERGSGYHGHKGFNWRTLEQRIAAYMTIERIDFTPWPWLGGWGNSQVWFHGRPRPESPLSSDLKNADGRDVG